MKEWAWQPKYVACLEKRKKAIISEEGLYNIHATMPTVAPELNEKIFILEFTHPNQKTCIQSVLLGHYLPWIDFTNGRLVWHTISAFPLSGGNQLIYLVE